MNTTGDKKSHIHPNCHLFKPPQAPTFRIDLDFAGRVMRFLKGEITWAQVEGWTLNQAYAFAKLGTDLIQSGQLSAAFKIFSCLHALNPKDWFFPYCMAQISRLQGKTEKAIGYLDKSIAVCSQKNNPRPEPWLLRSLCLLALKNTDQAQKDLKRVDTLIAKDHSKELRKMKEVAHAMLSMLAESDAKACMC
jgi:tetratricopeptide (TPR) repeat protein